MINKVKRNLIYGKSNGICPICGKEMIKDNKSCKDSYTIDHIVPQSLGGKDNVENLRAICMSCNATRSNRVGKTKIQLIKDRKCILDYEIKFIKDDINNKLIDKYELSELKDYLTYIYNDTIDKINKIEEEINEK